MQRSCLTLATLLFATVVHAAPQKAFVMIPTVKQGKAVLRQDGRVTTLAFSPTKGETLQIPLTHESDYTQGTNPPLSAKLVAESTGQYIVFTDTFASNPGNVQGECGASPTGERYLHVVSLKQRKETYSLLIESCLQDIEPAGKTPAWNPVKKTLDLSFTRYKGHKPHEAIQVDSDGSTTIE